MFVRKELNVAPGTSCLLTSRDYRLYFRDFGIGRRGIIFDVVSQRFDRHADASKNIRDVSKPETALLLLLLLLQTQRKRSQLLAQHAR